MPGYLPSGQCDGTLHLLSPIRQALAEYLFTTASDCVGASSVYSWKFGSGEIADVVYTT